MNCKAGSETTRSSVEMATMCSLATARLWIRLPAMVATTCWMARQGTTTCSEIPAMTCSPAGLGTIAWMGGQDRTPMSLISGTGSIPSRMRRGRAIVWSLETGSVLSR